MFITVFVLTVFGILEMVGVSFAEDSALTSAINGWSSELTGYLTQALGICVSLFAMYAGVRIAMKMVQAQREKNRGY
jgi:hypothetical protein